MIIRERKEWNVMYLSKVSFGRREKNGIERNENNNFRIFFPSLI